MWSFASRRGSTLVEVLSASAILAIGLSAVGTMLVQTSITGRDTTRKLEANALGVSTAESWASRGYDGLAALGNNVFDAGSVLQGGVVLYTRSVTLAPLSSLDAGTVFPGVVVRSQVFWSSSVFNTTNSTSFQVIVTGPFDAG
ncbi:MAG: prepilin-type N-terminal cleavage/methylation domain-containing protein [Archangium sp.]|nr:prepilin-type N-terminal cleavage/methylation domain-containing protein [Archangium sp.]